MARGVLRQLRARGFDASEYDRAQRVWRPRCSQCSVAVINGTACHETGCPNWVRAKKRQQEERC